jgi:hypothetical protein
MIGLSETVTGRESRDQTTLAGIIDTERYQTGRE